MAWRSASAWRELGELPATYSRSSRSGGPPAGLLAPLTAPASSVAFAGRFRAQGLPTVAPYWPAAVSPCLSLTQGVGEANPRIRHQKDGIEWVYRCNKR